MTGGACVMEGAAMRVIRSINVLSTFQTLQDLLKVPTTTCLHEKRSLHPLVLHVLS